MAPENDTDAKGSYLSDIELDRWNCQKFLRFSVWKKGNERSYNDIEDTHGASKDQVKMDEISF
jgi:hypothetical protein